MNDQLVLISKQFMGYLFFALHLGFWMATRTVKLFMKK